MCCDPCGLRGRTVKHLVKYLQSRKIAYKAFNWNHLPLPLAEAPRCLIISGSRFSWSQKNVPMKLVQALQYMFQRSLSQRFPVIGICFGMQSMIALHGGLIGPSMEGFVDRADTLSMTDYATKATVSLTGHRYHGDVVVSLAPHFQIIGKSGRGEIMGIQSTKTHRRWIGFQFHPEMREDTWYILDDLLKEKSSSRSASSPR